VSRPARGAAEAVTPATSGENARPTPSPAVREKLPDSAPSAEALVASCVLHDPGQIDDVLRGAGAGLVASRQLLARTVAALVAGDEIRAAQLARGLDTDASVTSSELDFVQRALAHKDIHAVSAGASRPSALLHAAELGLAARHAETLIEKRAELRRACELLSRVLLEELAAEWPPEPTAMRRWSQLVAHAQTGHRWRKDGDWPGTELKVEKGDSLITVRKRALDAAPALVLCTGLIARANQLTGDLIHPGQVLRIPTQRARMLVDLSAHWAFFLVGDEVAAAWEVGVGKPGRDTQPGTYYVGEKREEPMWFPPGQAPVPFGDPRNPLGTRWIELRTPAGEVTHLGFHGTNEPDSVGSDTSLGCVRLRNGDAEELYEILPRGTEVVIQP
jgi:lipoprotein-anchoring transpeptidase ErfK/SrfK